MSEPDAFAERSESDRRESYSGRNENDQRFYRDGRNEDGRRESYGGRDVNERRIDHHGRFENDRRAGRDGHGCNDRHGSYGGRSEDERRTNHHGRIRSERRGGREGRTESKRCADRDGRSEYGGRASVTDPRARRGRHQGAYQRANARERIQRSSRDESQRANRLATGPSSGSRRLVDGQSQPLRLEESQHAADAAWLVQGGSLTTSLEQTLVAAGGAGRQDGGKATSLEHHSGGPKGTNATYSVLDIDDVLDADSDDEAFAFMDSARIAGKGQPEQLRETKASSTEAKDRDGDDTESDGGSDGTAATGTKRKIPEKPERAASIIATRTKRIPKKAGLAPIAKRIPAASSAAQNRPGPAATTGRGTPVIGAKIIEDSGASGANDHGPAAQGDGPSAGGTVSSEPLATKESTLSLTTSDGPRRSKRKKPGGPDLHPEATPGAKKTKRTRSSAKPDVRASSSGTKPRRGPSPQPRSMEFCPHCHARTPERVGICDECKAQGKDPSKGFAMQKDNPWSEAALARDPVYVEQERARSIKLRADLRRFGMGNLAGEGCLPALCGRQLECRHQAEIGWDKWIKDAGIPPQQLGMYQIDAMTLNFEKLNAFREPVLMTTCVPVQEARAFFDKQGLVCLHIGRGITRWKDWEPHFQAVRNGWGNYAKSVSGINNKDPKNLGRKCFLWKELSTIMTIAITFGEFLLPGVASALFKCFANEIAKRFGCSGQRLHFDGSDIMELFATEQERLPYQLHISLLGLTLGAVLGGNHQVGKPKISGCFTRLRMIRW
jgi:hypothetical protein